MNSFPTNESIELSLPINPAYVSAARLTASSVAGRMGFDISETEDIKTAVSEACIFIIKKVSSQTKCDFKISFLLVDDSLQITLFAKGKYEDGYEEDLGVMMIKALMDNFAVSRFDDESIEIKLTKQHKENPFH